MAMVTAPLFWQWNRTKVAIVVRDGDSRDCPIVIEDVKPEFIWQPQISWTVLEASERLTRLGQLVFINPPPKVKNLFWLGRLLGIFREIALVRWFDHYTQTWYMEKKEEDKISVDSIYWDIYPVLSRLGDMVQVMNVKQIVNKINS
jgi:hypothetical protein